MTRVALRSAAIFVAVWAGVYLASLLAQEWVKVIPSSAFQPPAAVILTVAPERAQVCAEFERGLTSCRSIAEFRQWVRDRPKK